MLVLLYVLKAYLCLDSVYVGCDGELLFLMPKNTGTAVHYTLINTVHANTVDSDYIMARSNINSNLILNQSQSIYNYRGQFSHLIHYLQLNEN